MSSIKTVYGGGSIGRFVTEEEDLQKILQLLEAHKVKNIDSAQLYPGSEALLGKAGASGRFVIDTKWPGSFVPGTSKRDEVVRRAEESVKALGTEQVDIFYFHSPLSDADNPIEDTLAGVNDAYKRGLFQRFGLSNWKCDDVVAAHKHCKENDYVLPTAYQGPYSAIVRGPETDLFPKLRDLGIAFYAYSPVAGGFLTKTKQEVLDGAGRFDKSSPMGGMWINFLAKPSFLEALSEWDAIAADAGCSKAELANRWVKYNSALTSEHGDALIIGNRTMEQLEETLKGLDAGPLDKAIVERIEQIWQSIKHEAQTYMLG